MIFQKDEISLISQNLLAGSVGVMPSDTVYGIFARALNKPSVERIYSIKKRDLNKPFIVLISDIKELELFGIKLADYQLKVVNKYWPGPLSVIFDCNKSEFEYLHRGQNSLAFRFPKDKRLVDILKQTGPLVAPSANSQGAKPAESIEEAREYFGEKVNFYEEGKFKESKPSTLIKIVGDRVEILRN